MERTVEWMTGKGKAVCTIKLITSREINLDGDKVTAPCCELMVRAEIAGTTHHGHGEPRRVAGHAVAVAQIGDIGLKADTYEQIVAAIAEVKASPEWLAKEARAAKSAEADAQYDAHRQMMDNVMRER